MAVNPKRRTVFWLLGALGFMIALTALSVPFYRAFCQATGFGGTARKAEAASNTLSDKVVRVHFDTNRHDIPWAFKADVPYMDTPVGRTMTAFFTVTNTSDHAVTGRASYNILPDTMGQYFMKLQCFCFQNQTLQPGESRQFPVVFFLDPKLMDDSDTRALPDVTLSYTFFESKDGEQSSKN